MNTLFIIFTYLLCLIVTSSYSPEIKGVNESKITSVNHHSLLTMSIVIKDSLNDNPDYLFPQSITPSQILRGRSFTVTGRLVDLSTNQGIPNEPIKIFWNHFSWTEYENNRANLESLYLIGQGRTNSNGYYTIICADSSHSKATGLITVYAVFPGDPLLGPIQQNRQYTTDLIECYATVIFYMQANSTIVRENHSFFVTGILLFDNVSTPTPIYAAEGDNITINWLSTNYLAEITSYYINITLSVPNGTQVGVNHPVQASYNISKLNLPYTFGSISSEAQIGTTAADWCNNSINIFVYTGAGLTLTIDEPTPPGIGQYPEVVRENTIVSVSGILTNDEGDPFGYPVDLTIYIEGISLLGAIADNSGVFSQSFTINETTLSVGTNSITVNVDTGQGIIAQAETENITILGNTSITTPSVNGTLVTTALFLALPGEIIQIAGTIRDSFNNRAVANMPISAEWEDSGNIYLVNTSITGGFTINLQIPLTVNSTERNGTINLQSSSIQYYTPSSTSFFVDVFSEVEFTIRLNQTVIIENSTVTTISGNTIYTNSNFSFSGKINDQFNRPLKNRDIQINVLGIGIINITLTNSGTFSFMIISNNYSFDNQSYDIVIIFIDKPSEMFTFEILFESIPATPTPTPTTTTNGGINLSSKFAIGILISIVSLIIIVSVIYAFGRFKKSKKGMPITTEAELLDLPSIMKYIAESEKAKDYQRAVVFCYHAFALICMQDLGILNARVESPRELARLVASTNRVQVRDVTMLVMRYEEARFSDHKIDKNAFNLTKQALENIQLALKQEMKSS